MRHCRKQAVKSTHCSGLLAAFAAACRLAAAAARRVIFTQPDSLSGYFLLSPLSRSDDNFLAEKFWLGIEKMHIKNTHCF